MSQAVKNKIKLLITTKKYFICFLKNKDILD